MLHVGTPHKPFMTFVICGLTALLATSVIGCRRSDTGEQRAATEEEPPREPTEAESARGMMLDPRAGGANVGESCEHDRDCNAPLRCDETECAVPPAIDGETDDATPRAVLDVGGENVRVYLEIADDDPERQRGLMFRTRMAPDWGMLFVFPREAPRSFWMRNTYLPLDMLFLTEDGEIINVEPHARPLDVKPRYASEKPARYVLEVNAGFAREHGITAGQRVRLVDVPGDHHPRILQ